MQSLRNLFRIGTGPSSSHTLAPKNAAIAFRAKHPEAASYKVTLFGSLAATALGHATEKAVKEPFLPCEAKVIQNPDQELPEHPNGMRFEALDTDNESLGTWTVYSVGGGELRPEGETVPSSLYSLTTMTDIVSWAEQEGQPLWMFAIEHEEDTFPDFLKQIWEAMKHSIEHGLSSEGVLPGTLHLKRKAHQVFRQTKNMGPHAKRTGLLSAYALAAAEENAAGQTVVTAPTCGACGVVPSVLRYLSEIGECSITEISNALATAGIIGNLIKHNGSISGAEVGCQGEIGAACSMASGAAAQLLGGSPYQIEYAAEMGLEHHLGLTCDPVEGYVQIPCIERNAMAASRALSCAEYALLSDGRHRISFDQVVITMKQTGHDLPSLYRETSKGGLASTFPGPEEDPE